MEIQMVKWYIVAKIWGVLFTTVGPYETKDECITHMLAYYDEAKSRYANGERYTFMGLEVKPQNLKGQCKQK
jgi:hypothetical protein